MLFNSFEFTLFLPLVFIFYWFAFARDLRLQNLFIVAVSYLFYGWWDWRFLMLIAFTSLCSYLSGTLISKYRDRGTAAKKIAAVNVILNLLILCLFKYFNFFSENLAQLFRVFGYELDWVTLDILLPVGISFYTFQALSYTIDVYKRKIEPTNDVVSFFAFVSFFPQLVAGPIERSTNLLPQFYRKRKFDYTQAVDGLRQILWGLFKKIVIADNCARIVNDTFSSYQDYSGSTLLLGAVLFAFQIYGDFSGYSDIAIGTSRLFGFRLMRNFNYPYFSRNIAEFWRRWHISLTTWFRDYIYIPLGGSRRGKLISVRNTMIIFAVSGLWHGANMTFIAWGIFHGLLFLPLLMTNRNRKFTTDTVAMSRTLPSLRELTQMLATFSVVTIGWVIFRADTLTQGWDYLSRIFSPTLLSMPQVISNPFQTAVSIGAIIIMIITEWAAREKQHALENIPIRSSLVRWSLYVAITWSLFEIGGNSSSFIYFQF